MINNRKARRDAAKGKGTPKPVKKVRLSEKEKALRDHRNEIAKASRKANRGK